MDRCNSLRIASLGISTMLDAFVASEVMSDDDAQKVRTAMWSVVIDAENAAKAERLAHETAEAL